MDLTNFNVNASSEGKSAVEPGRHVLHWQGKKKPWLKVETDGVGARCILKSMVVASD